MIDILNADIMKEWESRLTQEQLDRALEYARGDGWSPTTNPPMYVWAEYFKRAELECPTKGKES